MPLLVNTINADYGIGVVNSFTITKNAEYQKVAILFLILKTSRTKGKD